MHENATEFETHCTNVRVFLLTFWAGGVVGTNYLRGQLPQSSSGSYLIHVDEEMLLFIPYTHKLKKKGEGVL